MNLSTTQLRILGSLLYFAAAALIINYFAQFTIQVWPFKIGELNWRVGATGLLMDALLGSIVPLTMMYFAGFVNNHRKTVQFLRIFSLVLGFAVIGMLLLFAIDSIQLRATLPQNVKSQFLKVAIRAGLVGTLLSILHIWIGLSVGKVMKSQGTVRTNAAKDPEKEGMLMVGSREPARPVLRSIDTADLKKEGTSGLSIDM